MNSDEQIRNRPERDGKPPTGWGVWAVLLLGAAIYLPGLGHECGLTQKDEFNLSVRTQIEMVNSGHFLTPFLNGEPRLKKPPLVYWIMAGLASLFGTSLFLARLPGVVFSLKLALAVVELAREAGVKKEREPWAGLLTLTCVGTYSLGRMALLDVPLAALSTWGILGFVRWIRTGRDGWLLLSAAAAGMANMVKGPLGPFVVIAVVSARLCVFGQWGLLRHNKRALLAALIVFAVLGLGWPVAMAMRWGDLFWSTISDQLFAKRFTGTGQGPLTVVGGLLGLLMPWSLILIASVANIARRRDNDDRRDDIWLLIWLLICTVPLFFLKSKFERYMTPAIPAAALLMARRFEAGSREFRVALWATAVLLVGTAVGVATPAVWLRAGPWGLWAVSVALAVAAGYAMVTRRNLLMGSILVGTFLCVTAGVLYPHLGVNALPHDLAERIGPNRKLLKLNSSRPAFLSLRLKRSIRSLRIGDENLDDLRQAIDEGAAIVVTGEHREFFHKALGKLGLSPQGTLLEWRAFGTRKTFLQFARRSASRQDWKEAWRARDLAGLRERYEIYADFVPKPSAAPR